MGGAKLAWLRSFPSLCLNCETATFLTDFGNPWTGLFNRTPRFVHVCSKCQRSFRDESVKDVSQCVVADRDAELQPDHEMVWDRRVTKEMA